MKEQPPNQASDAPETEPFFVPGFRPWRVPQASYAQAKERSQTWPKEKTKERTEYTVWIRIDISRKVRDVREGCGAYPKNFASRDTLRPLCFVLHTHKQKAKREAHRTHQPNNQQERKQAKETESKLERAGAPALGGRLKQTTKRGEAEVAKAGRPQPRRGASAAANTRKSFSRVGEV